MKKTILILAAFALVAFSCTKTEVKDDTPKKGINFSAYTVKPTKAELGPQVDVTTGNLGQFEVTAIGNGAIYFEKISFTKNASSIWVSNPEYFWPAYSLDFYAYNTPENGTFTIDRENIVTSGPKLKFSPSSELAEQEDLVAAYAAGQKETDNNDKGAIGITFNHYLTQVIVKAKCSNSLYSVVVDGVKLANMAGEGTYTFGNPGTMVATEGHVNSSSSVDYDEGFGEKTLGGDAVEVMTNGTNGKWYLIPQTVTAWNRLPATGEPDMKNTSNGTYLALKVKITANGGALKIYPAKAEQSGYVSGWMAVPVPAQLKFEQGKKYVITVDFFSSTGNGAGYVDPEVPSDLDGDGSATNDNGKKIIGGAIKFDATVNPWGDIDVTILL